MSGIFGVIDKANPVGPVRLLAEMGDSLHHFGWQQVETYCDQLAGVGLGRVGLGVFNQGVQPVWNEAGTVALIMAGEIYNQRSSADITSAEQHVLGLYQQFGDGFVHHLNGAFVIAVWDNQHQHLIIANDRFGTYPLYYAEHNGRLIFGPELKAIFCDGSFQKKLDFTALAQYIRFQYLLGQRTFFENLYLLPNASTLTFSPDNNRLRLEKYWDFSDIPQLPAGLTFEDAVDEIGHRLKTAVDRQTMGGHRLGIYLSGGVDSRIILGLIDPGHLPIPTITYGLPDSRDVVYAQRLANIMGTSHHHFPFTDGQWVQDYAPLHFKLTEGAHSWIHSHGISVAQQARQLIDVNLTGFAGGITAVDWDDQELFSTRDETTFLTHLFHQLSQNTTWPSVTEAEELAVYQPQLAKRLQGRAFDSLKEELREYTHLPPYQRAASFAVNNPDRRLFMNFVVFHRAFFENRFPFLDYDYFNLIYALPPTMLSRRRLRRALICKRATKLALVPYDKDNLPITASKSAWLRVKFIHKSKNFVNRRIASIFPEYQTLYADYETWLRNELRAWGEDLLLGERTLQRQIFDPKGLRSLWQRHQSGLELHTIGKLAPIMTYELLLRNFWDT